MTTYAEMKVLEKRISEVGVRNMLSSELAAIVQDRLDSGCFVVIAEFVVSASSEAHIGAEFDLAAEALEELTRRAEL